MCDHLAKATTSHKRPLIQNKKYFPDQSLIVGNLSKRALFVQATAATFQDAGYRIFHCF